MKEKANNSIDFPTVVNVFARLARKDDATSGSSNTQNCFVIEWSQGSGNEMGFLSVSQVILM